VKIQAKKGIWNYSIIHKIPIAKGIGNFVQNIMRDCSTVPEHLGQVMCLALVPLK